MNHKMTVLLAACLMTSARMSQADEGHQVELLMESKVVLFGAPLEVTVRHRNAASTPWKLLTPDKTPVRVFFRRRGATIPSMAQLPPFRSVPFKDGLFFRSPLEPTPIVLDAGTSYTFRVPVHDLSTNTLKITEPGIYDLWVQNVDEDLTSEKISVLVVFAEETVSYFIRGLSDPDRRGHIWRLDWLQRFDPALEVKWNYARDSDEIRKEKVAAIQARMKEFQEFWERREQDKTTQLIIDEINEEAGLPPDARELLRKELERVKRDAAAKQNGNPATEKRDSLKSAPAGDEE